MLQSQSQPDAATWNRALERAIEEALDVLTETLSGRTFVESGTIPGVVYEVTPQGCSCKSGQQGVPDKHRACLLAQAGILPLDIKAAAERRQPEACLWCFGTGRVRNDHQQRYDPCDMCDGSGQRQNREPTGNALVVWADSANEPAAA